MKLSLYLKLAALAVMASASSLLANTVGTDQNFEFEWQTQDATFSPTFLMITAVLNVEASAASAITGFEITTPNGAWTPTAFTPTSGQPTGAPSWLSGSSLTISGTTDAPVLTFNGDGDFLESPGTVHYQVSLQTDSISGSTFVAPNDAGPGTSTGSWVAVGLDATAPDAANTLILFVLAAIGLGTCNRRQRARAEA